MEVILFEACDLLNAERIRHIQHCLREDIVFFCAEKNGLPIPDFSIEKLPDGLVAIVRSSGSTGTPKLIPIKKKQLRAAVRNAPKGLLPEANQRWLLALSPTHMGGLAVLLRSHMIGNEVVVAKSPKVTDILEALKVHQADLISLVPTQMLGLIESGAINLLQNMKSILLGGGPAPKKLRELIYKHRLPVFYSFGMSETLGQLFSLPASEIEPTTFALNLVGRINDEHQYRIDNEKQLWVKGPQVFERYLSNHKKREKNGWFLTGDIAKAHSNGLIEILMRRSDIIISGGKNISPQEVVENVSKLTAIPPEHLFAKGIEDEKWGQIVGLWIETDAIGDAFQKDRIIKQLDAMPSHLKPRKVILQNTFPRSSIGKVLGMELDD